MSILIKGIMNMPKTCAECMIEQEVVSTDEHGFPYVSSYRCPLVYPSITGEVRHEKRLINCPLLPLPAGHGRLGDLDRLFEVLGQDVDRWIVDEVSMIETDDVLDAIQNAPTIVPAEGGNADA